MEIKKPKDLQINSIDDELEVSLWNAIYYTFIENSDYDYISNSLRYQHKSLFLQLWEEVFKSSRNSMSFYPDKSNFATTIQSEYTKRDWNEKYDVIEFLEQNVNDIQIKEAFKNYCNKVLEREYSAYRFVGDQLCQIINKEEIKEIENAINSPIPAVNQHLTTAITLMSNRNNPDYRNSIKESISAIESICIKIIGNKQEADTLGKALNKLTEKNPNLISAYLQSSFKQLYKYTNSEDGIRHAIEETTTVSLTEARFMLIICSAFINYLISKADDVQISLF